MDKWISNVHPHQGRLHRQLGVQCGCRIPKVMLNDIQNAPIGSVIYGTTITPRLKRRAMLALLTR